MEFEIELLEKPEQATAETDSDREAALLEAKVQPEFGLSARQLDMVREFIEKKGIEYVREKIAVVDSEPRKNAARTFLAALKGDWKLPVKRKPPPIPKSQPPPQEPPPEISDEEWAKQREKARVTFNEFKESMRGGPLDGGFSVENRDRLGVRKNDRFFEPGINRPGTVGSQAPSGRVPT